MKKASQIKYFFPFIQWYALIIFLITGTDFILQQFDLVFTDISLDIIDTLVIFYSFIYTLRKCKIIQFCSPKQLLWLHEYVEGAGSTVILVHGGIHSNALLLMVVIADINFQKTTSFEITIKKGFTISTIVHTVYPLALSMK